MHFPCDRRYRLSVPNGPAVSSDGLMLATSSADEPTRLWEISSGRLLGDFGAGLVAGAPASHPFEPWLFLVDGNRFGHTPSM